MQEKLDIVLKYGILVVDLQMQENDCGPEIDSFRLLPLPDSAERMQALCKVQVQVATLIIIR